MRGRRALESVAQVAFDVRRSAMAPGGVPVDAGLDDRQDVGRPAAGDLPVLEQGPEQIHDSIIRCAISARNDDPLGGHRPIVRTGLEGAAHIDGALGAKNKRPSPREGASQAHRCDRRSAPFVAREPARSQSTQRFGQDGLDGGRNPPIHWIGIDRPGQQQHDARVRGGRGHLPRSRGRRPNGIATLAHENRCRQGRMLAGSRSRISASCAFRPSSRSPLA